LYEFSKTDICDEDKIAKIFKEYNPDAIFHLAAESHVDRSILNPIEFVNTNVLGTCTLLNVAKNH